MEDKTEVHDKSEGKGNGFWKTYWISILVVTLIYTFLTLGKSRPAGRTPFAYGYVFGVVICTFTIVSLFFYMFYRFRNRKKK